MTKRVLGFVAALACVAGVVVAQDTGSVRGTVTDDEGRGIAGVAVIINETGAVETTGGDGSFAFRSVPAGTYSVSFTLGSNSTSVEGVEVAAGGTATVDQSVDWDTTFLDSITVFSASRREERIVDAPASISAFSEEEIAQDVATGQIAKVIEFAPGVEVNQSGIYDFNINARGFNSSLNRRVQTLVDGREPSVPFLGSTDWLSMTAMADVAKMELVRGPSSALYGANAFNGVLNVITQPARDLTGGEVTISGGELSTLKGEVLWGGEISDSWYLKFIGGFTDGEDFFQSRNVTTEYAGLPMEAEPGSNQYDNTTATLRLDKEIGDDQLFTLETNRYEGSGGTVVTGIGRVQVTDLERDWTRLNYSNRHFNVLAYRNTRQSPDQKALSSGGRIFLDSEQTKLEIQGNRSFADGRTRLVVGASHKEEEIDTANAAGFQTLVFSPVDHDFTAAFAQVDFDLTDRVKLVLASRFDDSSLHDSQVSPKAALVIGLNDRHTLRLSYNEAFQVPNYSEFFLDAPTAIPGVGASIDLRAIEAGLCAPFGVSCGFDTPVGVRALGNTALTLEEITSIEVGYSAILADKAFLTIDYYSNELDNFITDLTVNPFGLVNPQFGPYTPPPNHPAPQLLLTTLAGALGPAAAFLSRNVDGTPIFALVSYANAGQVDTQGIDLGLNYYVTPFWQLEFSYSWFDFDIQDTGGFAESNLLPNAPEGKASFGLTYSGDRFGASIKGRWVDDFLWAAGAFQGPVPSYETFTVAGRYDVSDAVTVGVNVSNAFDDEHYQSFGGDLLTRRALGFVTINW